MILKVQGDDEYYFRFALEILSAWHPFNGLRESQKDLFAQFLYYNYVYRTIPKEERYLIIMGKTVKNKIGKTLGISKANIDNNLSLLRKHGLIDESNQVPDKYLITCGEDIRIKFKSNKNED